VDILTGLSGLKTAADLTRMLRESLKSGQIIKGDEIAGRIGEIYDYIVDSKDALVDAKDQIVQLRDEIKKLQNALEREKKYVFMHGVYWETFEITGLHIHDDEGNPISEIRYHGPFCPLCKDGDDKAVHLKKSGATENGVPAWWCEIHKTEYGAPTMQD
jgi:hypothetical protein